MNDRIIKSRFKKRTFFLNPEKKRDEVNYRDITEEINALMRMAHGKVRHLSELIWGERIDDKSVYDEIIDIKDRLGDLINEEIARIPELLGIKEYVQVATAEVEAGRSISINDNLLITVRENGFIDLCQKDSCIYLTGEEFWKMIGDFYKIDQLAKDKKSKSLTSYYEDGVQMQVFLDGRVVLSERTASIALTSMDFLTVVKNYANISVQNQINKRDD